MLRRPAFFFAARPAGLRVTFPRETFLRAAFFLGAALRAAFFGAFLRTAFFGLAAFAAVFFAGAAGAAPGLGLAPFTAGAADFTAVAARGSSWTAKAPPCGSRNSAIQLPPGTSTGPAA